MLKAAIIIDKWKLDIFKKVLNDEGFKFEKLPGVNSKTFLLRVETETCEALAPFVLKANNKAARSRDKRYN